ncbi:MAG: hypothetical protein FJX66_14825 [Alphaproteobacteria bacterium]|nr:hypothetical protein [Alphaproteobacteria bacterium]
MSFDWQFLTDETNASGQPNDFAFVVIEGQLFLLANSDNAGSSVASVLANQNLTVDGQQFDNATAFQNDTTFTVTDANNDGVVNIAFGVVNGGTSASAASALIVDDVQVVPHVV